MMRLKDSLEIDPAVITRTIINRLTEGFQREILIITRETASANTEKEELFAQSLTIVQENVNEYISVALAITRGINIEEGQRTRTQLQKLILTYIIGALLIDYYWDNENLTQKERESAFNNLFSNDAKQPSDETDQPKYSEALKALGQIKKNLFEEIEKNKLRKIHGETTSSVITNRITEMVGIMTKERDYTAKNKKEPTSKDSIESLDEYLNIIAPSMGVGNILLFACLTLDTPLSPEITNTANSLDRYLRIYNDYRTHHHENKITAMNFVPQNSDISDTISIESENALTAMSKIENETIRAIATRIHTSITIRYDRGEFEEIS